MASDLTTLAKLRTYLGTASLAWSDTQLTNAVNAANYAIEQYCDTVFAAANYAEWIDGTNQEYLVLEHVPLIRVNRVATDYQDCLGITNTSAGLISAHVSVAGGSINLVVVGGANEGSDQLTLSTYTTMALLKTAIEALSKGWSCTIQNEEQPKSLRPVSYDAITTSGEYVYLQGADDGIDFTISESSTGILWRGHGWPCGTRSVYADYRAGYETIPAPLETAANSVAADIVRSARRDGALQSETLGDYSWTRAAAWNVLDAHKASLGMFRKVAWR